MIIIWKKNADATSESCYEIKNNSTSEVVDGDYTIDDHFNIKSADGAVDTNLFCGDTPYFQFPTDFLYITKSTDNGATWSAPQLVDAKNESEQVFLIGPGTRNYNFYGKTDLPVLSVYKWSSENIYNLF